MVDYESMGKRIRYKRRIRNLSQEEVARAINISVSFYGNIERGIRIPSIDTLVDIANFLGTGTDFLLAESVTVAGKRHTREELRVLSRYLREQIDELSFGGGELESEQENLLESE